MLKEVVNAKSRHGRQFDDDYPCYIIRIILTENPQTYKTAMRNIGAPVIANH